MASVQNSINQLANAENGALAQQQSLMWYLLFRGDAVGDNSTKAGAFAEGGSAMGGVRGQINLGGGFSIFGGIAVGQEDYNEARLGASPWGALAGRYIFDNNSAVKPFLEIGGWLAPDAPFNFSRSYANGVGSARGSGRAVGTISYVYARPGVALKVSPVDEFDPAAEIGRASFNVGGYAEPLTSGNPFPATVSGGSTATTIGKIEGTWTHRFTNAFEASLYGAFAHAWANPTGIVAAVNGVGSFSAVNSDNLNWGEYGVQVGYRLNANVKVNAFADGLAGGNGVGDKLHVGLGINAAF